MPDSLDLIFLILAVVWLVAMVAVLWKLEKDGVP